MNTFDSNSSNFEGKHIHFMGAGGIGVSALMELAHIQGARVSGCDCSGGGQCDRLKARGFEIQIGHAQEHLNNDVDILVHTAAVSESHPEVMRAKTMRVEVYTRMRMLGQLLQNTRAICVSGSHGKTTITWMIGHVLQCCDQDPAVLVGGVVASLKSNVRLPNVFRADGTTPFVVETDESDNRLGEIKPTIAVVSNIDNDHMDRYGSLDALEQAFTTFMESTAEHPDSRAALVGCGDDPRVCLALQKAAQTTGNPGITYGFSANNILQAVNIREMGLYTCFDVIGPFGLWRDVTLPMPGRHNILNAMAAAAVALRLGLRLEQIKAALASCERVGRRFEIKGMARGVRVIDDYGHHPTELAATIKAARSAYNGRLAMVFQPHRYSRTQHLLQEFAQTFAEYAPDLLLLLPIYAASEAPIPGIDHHVLAQEIQRLRKIAVIPVETHEAAVQMLLDWTKSGDSVLTQGAGDITQLGPEVLKALKTPYLLSAVEVA